MVGDRGVSLSGGQRARINLARAVYRQADLYLLDDPLSAVDTHVARHLYQKCITQYLDGKTRILVTHQLQFLKRADHIAVLDRVSMAYQLCSLTGISIFPITFQILTSILFYSYPIPRFDSFQSLQNEGFNFAVWINNKKMFFLYVVAIKRYITLIMHYINNTHKWIKILIKINLTRFFQ